MDHFAHVNQFFDTYSKGTADPYGIHPAYYHKSFQTTPLSTVQGCTYDNRPFDGVNFACQDYLSLAHHEQVKQAAMTTLQNLSYHTCGSSLTIGNTKLSHELEQVICKFTKYQYCSLFVTGWTAGFGCIRGLVKEHDYILIDTLSHNCLQEGAYAATKNVIKFAHLSNSQVEHFLIELRNKKQHKAGIMVITEGLFSMDSDSPDIKELQQICTKYGAVLMVDVAHDLGCLGKTGRGIMEDQNMVGKVDIVMGSFSKTFGTNGGFVCTNSKPFFMFLEMFSTGKIFTNYISPVQCAVALKCFELVQSSYGDEQRAKLKRNIQLVRKLLLQGRVPVIGVVESAIIPFSAASSEEGARIFNYLLDHHVITNAAGPHCCQEHFSFPFTINGQSHGGTNCASMSSHLQCLRSTWYQKQNVIVQIKIEQKHNKKCCFICLSFLSFAPCVGNILIATNLT